jgi:hypothetical protein
LFVVGIDVAHVYATLFRTYFDGPELKRHAIRYAVVPASVYAAGAALYQLGPSIFWRVLAYTALFHFVRQQVGWAALYRARAGQVARGAATTNETGGSTLLDRIVDDAAVYAATLYPVLVWHARLDETRFAWFVEGDFVDLSAWSASILPAARALYLLALGAFLVRQAHLVLTTATLQAGKLVVVVTTAACWYVGIVATNSDFDFTVTNVIVHGVPYVALLWAYADARRGSAPAALASRVAAAGFGAFCVVLLGLAFAEELAWDRFVWADRPWLFGGGTELGATWLAWVVPLLAVPQGTHYVLDGFLWRRGATAQNPAQRAALGFGTA